MASAPDDRDRGHCDKLGERRCCAALAQKHTVAVTSCSPSTRPARNARAATLRAPIASALGDRHPTTARASWGTG
jgi:hypothetical protein